ncbi:hypothetical protein FrEUN1fDRAFT_5038 [Parafrankia sp. EUN1f]|nr:hypothetical protein FrEUN1fDRAFT_5038 [Parafrankia sp. EUN1f]
MGGHAVDVEAAIAAIAAIAAAAGRPASRPEAGEGPAYAGHSPGLRNCLSQATGDSNTISSVPATSSPSSGAVNRRSVLPIRSRATGLRVTTWPAEENFGNGISCRFALSDRSRSAIPPSS